MKYVLLPISLLFILTTQGQRNINRSGISIDVSAPSTVLGAEIRPLIKVVFSNKTKQSILVHDSLVVGEIYDNFGNVVIEIEKRGPGNTYSPLPIKSSRHFFNSSNDTPERVFKTLMPKSYCTYYLNLHDATGNHIEKGEYRVKCRILYPPKERNIKYEMQYFESNWIIICVIEYIVTEHK